MNRTLFGFTTAILLAGFTGTAQAQIAGTLRAGIDTTLPTDGMNLTSYTNSFQNTIGGFEFDSTFTSGFDMFHIAKRDLSQDIPFAALDDSISVFPTDTQGIVDENDNDPFFGIGDTVNDDTAATSGQVTATWVFDISSATADVNLSIDLAAMGDFEAADSFVFSAGIDGGAKSTVADIVANEDIDFTYTLANGTTMTTLNDPVQLNGTTLTNNFVTFDLGTIAGSASASTLELELTVTTNGGDEIVAFRNILLSEDGGPGLTADLSGDGDVDDEDLGAFFSAFTGPDMGPSLDPRADLSGDGDVDDEDLGAAFSQFTGPLGPASVPEPTSLALLGLGGLALARRRRG